MNGQVSCGFPAEVDESAARPVRFLFVGVGPFSPAGQVADADVPLPAADLPSDVGRPRLCVGMATYDDFGGVWFTIQAICMYQTEVLADVSFLVIDNHPEGPAASALRALED